MFLKRLKEYIPLLFIIIFTLPVIRNLLRPGFFVTDDGEWMIIRLSAFHQELAKGQFPVRFLNRLNNGYGYPVATFLYPGFMYLAEIPKVLGFGFIDSVKIVFIFSVLLASVFSFLWLKRVFGKKPAFLGSLVYIYSPYFLWDIYKRGSVGEVLALGIVPFILWAMEKRSWPLVSIGYGLLILAHNTLAFLFIPFLLLYQCINSLRQKKLALRETILHSSFSLFAGLGLSSFFWIPAVLELKFTVFNQIVVSNWKDYFLRLEDISLLGWFNLTVFGLALFLLLKNLKKWVTQYPIGYLVTLSFLLGVFLALPVSSFLWEVFPWGRLVQFPFRFLSWEVLASSYLAAFLVNNISEKWQSLVAAVAVSMVIVMDVPFSQPEEFISKPDSYYATNEATTTVRDEYMPKWVKIKPQKRAEKKVERVDEETVQINTVYWPGWKVYVDGQEKRIDYDNQMGLMRVKVSAGDHEVKSVFVETPLRLLADMSSLLSFIFIVLFSPIFERGGERRIIL